MCLFNIICRFFADFASFLYDICRKSVACICVVHRGALPSISDANFPRSSARKWLAVVSLIRLEPVL